MDTKKLLNALKIAEPALGNNSIHGVESYHFTTETVTASNGIVTISTQLGTDFPVTGSINGKNLYSLLKSFTKEVTMEVIPEGLLVKSGNSLIKLPVEQINTAFLGDMVESGVWLTLPSNDMFIAGIRNCMNSVNKKSLIQSGSGIRVFLSPTECRMYSTDGITFSRFVFPVEGYTEMNVWLPRSFCEIFTSLCSHLEKTPNYIHVTEKYIKVDFGDTSLRHGFHALPPSQGVREMVDTGVSATSLTDIPNDMLDALKRCKLISPVVNFSYEDTDYKAIQILAKGSKSQEVVEELKFEYPNVLSVNFEVGMFLKVLETSKSIGFGPDYLLLRSIGGNYDFVCSAKE